MWFRRNRKLLEIRQAWAKPVARERRLDTIAASHAARRAALGARALDGRAWEDLDLDEVFVAIDRTTSTLGQHALYHRLRTAPVADHLAEFETLVERLRGSAAVRERAQFALSRLQDAHGYDVWWLGAPDALERQPWYAFFPVLTAATVILAVAALFSSAAIIPLLAMVAVNMAVRRAPTIGPWRLHRASASWRRWLPPPSRCVSSTRRSTHPSPARCASTCRRSDG